MLYGSESAQDIHLDADTMSFGHVAAILEDVRHVLLDIITFQRYSADTRNNTILI